MRWFWADLHFDHDNIVTKMLRKADSPEHWYDTAIDAINLFVDRQDALYLLGDFAFKRPGYWRAKINCRNVYLIRGNHEPGAKKLQNVFGGNVYDIKEVKVHGVRTILCHYPMMFWNRSHRESYHLYGHIHYSQPREAFMDLAGDRRSMDVSPEASMAHLGVQRPFSETDIHNILSIRRGHEADIPNEHAPHEWNDDKNHRRCDLIDKEIDGTLTSAEQFELDILQDEMLAYRRKVAPLPLDDLRELHQELPREANGKNTA